MALELIETIEVGSGGAASIEFTSIPQDGVDLLLVLSARNSVASNGFSLQPNGATTNLSAIRLLGNGSSVISSSESFIEIPVANSSMTASTFGNSQIYLSNYTGSSAKSISVSGVNENNATTAIQVIRAALWNDTAAITSIELIPNGGGSAVQYSTASLYKIS